MNRRLLTFASAIVFLGGSFLSAGWVFWGGRSSDDAWTIDHIEQVVSGTSAEQEVEATFHLKNLSRRPLRILGSTAC